MVAVLKFLPLSWQQLQTDPMTLSFCSASGGGREGERTWIRRNIFISDYLRQKKKVDMLIKMLNLGKLSSVNPQFSLALRLQEKEHICPPPASPSAQGGNYPLTLEAIY